MSKEVDPELELSKRMAGEVYPELLRLMEKTKIKHIVVHSQDNEEDSRLFIYANGGVLGLQRPIQADDLEYNDDFLGEADDEDDEYGPPQINITNVAECPLYNGYYHLDYVYYCDQVLLMLETLMAKEQKIYAVLKKIDRIPFRKEVLTEKYKSNE